MAFVIYEIVEPTKEAAKRATIALDYKEKSMEDFVIQVWEDCQIPYLFHCIFWARESDRKSYQLLAFELNREVLTCEFTRSFFQQNVESSVVKHCASGVFVAIFDAELVIVQQGKLSVHSIEDEMLNVLQLQHSISDYTVELVSIEPALHFTLSIWEKNGEFKTQAAGTRKEFTFTFDYNSTSSLFLCQKPKQNIWQPTTFTAYSNSLKAKEGSTVKSIKHIYLPIFLEAD